MISFNSNKDDFNKNLLDLINLFSSHIKKNVVVNANFNFDKNDLSSTVTINGKDIFFSRKIEDYTKLNTYALTPIELKRIQKRFAKNAIYNAINNEFKIDLPWGSLSGVKPVSLIRNLFKKENFTKIELEEFLINEFKLSKNKVKIAFAIIENEPKIEQNNNNICVYINIPFCPERCSYCSFISRVTSENDSIISEYINTLCREINASKSLLDGKTVTSLYVGGGTPSILDENLLEKLLSNLVFIKAKEFVFECGRADTLSEKKLEILKKYGVTRICVNPQTFNEKVLNKINRHIKNEKVVNMISLAKNNFIVNSDLIAGLPTETYSSFKKSINTLIKLKVDNISVHSLAIKRTSDLFCDNIKSGKLCEKMLGYAIKILDKNGYMPYYLYRLKNTYNGLENIGFCKDNTECLFNICTMDELLSVIAFGANGISKKIDFENNYIDRVENPKDVATYINNIEKYITRKIDFFN